jgi:hypothetical protein
MTTPKNELHVRDGEELHAFASRVGWRQDAESFDAFLERTGQAKVGGPEEHELSAEEARQKFEEQRRNGWKKSVDTVGNNERLAIQQGQTAAETGAKASALLKAKQEQSPGADLDASMATSQSAFAKRLANPPKRVPPQGGDPR